MSKIISINGVDNTGKTTQSRLLQIRNSYSVRIVDNIANFNQTLHKNLDKN
jgi:thymidylate kinase